MKKLFLFALLLCIPLFAYAAGFTIDDFEADTTGALVGQNGWVDGGTGSSSQFTVQNSVVYAGAQALLATDNYNSDWCTTKKTYTSVASTTFTFAIRASATNASSNVLYDEGATNRVSIAFRNNTDHNISFTAGGSTDTLLSSITNGVWYVVQVQINSAGSQIRARANATTPGGTWTSFHSQAFTVMDTIRIQACGDNNGTVMYWDDFTADEGGAAASAAVSEDDPWWLALFF